MSDLGTCHWIAFCIRNIIGDRVTMVKPFCIISTRRFSGSAQSVIRESDMSITVS
ncbi:hypothetical protein I7I50_09934 [Histoplasma capsulatum G186AR]|uniref:Uncharacterized protein n=1 Tax=Ajellomyces capsulatus TaxID=5037 RepID=A0A8H7Z2X1_AJECA|nr:hypothetical protein I7I52_01172 [Histoplasma capsulatum]QSS68833.1 hypothetical protein I7I50_09934 [Histoplasma capsulatum G186AR]